MSIGTITNYLLKDLKLKVLALTFSLVLWFSMTYMGESRMGFLVPLSFNDVGEGMTVRNTDTREVVVTE